MRSGSNALHHPTLKKHYNFPPISYPSVQAQLFLVAPHGQNISSSRIYARSFRCTGHDAPAFALSSSAPCGVTPAAVATRRRAASTLGRIPDKAGVRTNHRRPASRARPALRPQARKSDGQPSTTDSDFTSRRPALALCASSSGARPAPTPAANVVSGPTNIRHGRTPPGRLHACPGCAAAHARHARGEDLRAARESARLNLASDRLGTDARLEVLGFFSLVGCLP
ncbi:hypothetical protein PsYK624_115880 [Phanerochaete sordida]|uniref:Uncharacterized protein n=1 Tax=Phanerochaete sordida TaxID=48140 RepID=A0A9P3GKZ9_9APHY|nr:hypothetical protein PsYK624_115880 [Phanerochaete sordida]